MSEIDYSKFPVLVVDDEPNILESIELAYGDEFRILTADGGAKGLVLLSQNEVAVVLADQRMPGMAGVEFLERTMAIKPELIRIILTGYADIDVLIDAINASRVYHYVTKPWDHQDLRTKLLRAIDTYCLERENARLLAELKVANELLASENRYWRERDARDYAPNGIVGGSRRMRELFSLLDKVSPTSANVLVHGETGTGKELIARAVHDRSPRREKIYVAVNCATLSENLLESELFGHRRGSFTGALSDKKGLFEVAHGGTIFLDEISETTPALQAKLLRVLQEGEVMPVGETRPRKVDVRVVAATNRQLDEEVAAGRFRKDLYYRLCVFPLALPPLRERLEDIADLAHHFLEKHGRRIGKPIRGISAEALDCLQAYSYPGNVRELENELERAVILTDPGEEICAAALSEALRLDEDADSGAEAESSHKNRLDSFARAEIQEALKRHGGNKTHAAQDLGITYQGLLKRMRRLGLMK